MFKILLKTTSYLLIIIILTKVTMAKILPSEMLDPSLVPLEVKVGQMLLVGFSGDTYNREAEEYVKKYKVGGIILFNTALPLNRKPNIISPSQLQTLTADLQKNADITLFIAADVEGGKVARLRKSNGFKDFKSAKEIGTLGKDAAYKQGLEIGEMLASNGINFNFAPVVDLAINKDNPVIAGLERAFSNDYKEVVEYAQYTINGLHQSNIITAIKHFPGHGSSTKDSHLGFVDITNTYKIEELLVYQELINLGYNDAIMTAHVVDAKIDAKYPASLSKAFNSDLLRNKLQYKGLIITDDLKMGAIENLWSLEQSIILAINAGANVILYGNNIGEYNRNFVKDATEIIINAVNRGTISMETIDNSYLLIMKLKKDYFY